MEDIEDIDFSPLFAASFIFICSLSIGFLLFKCVGWCYKEDSLGASLCYDFIRSMLVCVYPFGFAIIQTYYGKMACAGCIVIVQVTTAHLIPKGKTNLLTWWLGAWDDYVPFKRLVLQTIAMVAGGLTAYQLGIYLYRTELHKYFATIVHRYDTGQCRTKLKIPVFQAFFVEAVGILYVKCISAERFYSNDLLDSTLKAANDAAVVMMGTNLTGMFMNPIKAMVHTYGCEQVPLFSHVMVYWAAPFAGAWLASRFTYIY